MSTGSLLGLLFILDLMLSASSYPRTTELEEPEMTNQPNDKYSEPRVVVKAHDGVVARQPVEQFFYPNEGDDEAVIRRDLFLQAFQILQQKHHDDPRSYFQISGIHGIPYTVYDNTTDPYNAKYGGWGGYCHHGNILFPTFHRPYLLLIEQEIINCAQEFISTIGPLATGAIYQLEDYIDQAKRIRFPYWDWADPHTQAYGVPQIFLDHTVHVTYPNIATIRNPLRCYVLPVELVDEQFRYSSAPECIPTASPNFKPFAVDGTPHTPAHYPTIRHPTESYQSNVDQLQFDIMQASTLLIRPGVYDMLNTSQYDRFSNHFSDFDPTKQGRYGIYSSLEWVHDNVHILIGGPAGHMANPKVASFDPIFYFHHVNTDRLFAVWQALHPTEWITKGTSQDGNIAIRPGQEINAETELFPFRMSYNEETRKSTFWNSNDVRQVEKLGYTYPELEETNVKKLRKEMLRAYRPAFWARERIIANCTGVPKHAFGGPYNLLLFINVPQDKLLIIPKSDIHYAGRVGIFSRGSSIQCSACLASTIGKKMSFMVDITAAVRSLNLRVDNPPIHKDNPNAPTIFTDGPTAPLLSVSVVAEYAGRRHLMPKIKVSSITDKSDWFPDKN